MMVRFEGGENGELDFRAHFVILLYKIDFLPNPFSTRWNLGRSLFPVIRLVRKKSIKNGS